MAGGAPAVIADGLTKRFGLAYAVRDVSLFLPPSSVLLVVGPNGSGKTTLLRVLATAIRPTAGRAQVFGSDLIRNPEGVRRVTALVGTAPGFYESLSANENLAFCAAMSGVSTRPEPWVERVGLGSVADRPLRTLSQGMKRRLALARAWLRSPRLLLLDEPFGGLDVEGNRLVDALIDDTRSRGGSVILCTHEWERGLRLADTVLLLVAGRPMESAAAHEVSAPRPSTLTGGPR